MYLPCYMSVRDSVVATLSAFPRASSPGASQLSSQHLLDVITTTTPSARQCLESLTYLINFLLSGHADPRIAPWCGAPLTLLKKQVDTDLLLLGKFYSNSSFDFAAPM